MLPGTEATHKFLAKILEWRKEKSITSIYKTILV